jgi:Flp pilus assembly protein TadD
MADTSRVDDLRKRYSENPRRFFAPLANEYRKTGFHDRALLLCEKHLGEQPGNMNGLIVYGQTLFEAGRHADARLPFEKALELDPENLIALRHLGDIARLAEDAPEAQRWYGRVLELDRRNEEVRALFEQVGGAVPDPGSGPSVRRPSAASRAPDFHTARTVEVTPRSVADATTLEVPPPALADADTVEITPPAATDADTVEITPPAAPRYTSADALDLVLPDDFVSEPASAPSAAPRRASLLDINFDFTEPGSAPVPGDPVSAAPAASEPTPPAAAPAVPAVPAVPAAPEPFAPLPAVAESGATSETSEFTLPEFSDAEIPEPDSMASDLLDASPMFAEPLPGIAETGEEGNAPPAPRASEPLFEAPPEPITLGGVTPVEGLQLADYSADVEPLADLEPGEFEGGGADVAPLADLESAEFEAPGPAPVRAASPTPSSAAPTFVTETMAKLYLEQGFRAEAIEVYRRLVEQDPTDAEMRRKLADLEAASRVSVEFDSPFAPESEPELESAPAPEANAMLADVSFAGVELATPSSAPRVPTPVDLPVATGPSAREFFAAFAQRSTARDTPAPDHSGDLSYNIPAALSPLDGLFGVEVSAEDQRAANVLAGVGTTVAPSGTSSLDTLFGGAEASSGPTALPEPARASEKLKFDQHFSSSSTPQPGAPVAAPVEPPAAGDVPAEGAGDDDLDQFQGWLKGLTS